MFNVQSTMEVVAHDAREKEAEDEEETANVSTASTSEQNINTILVHVSRPCALYMLSSTGSFVLSVGTHTHTHTRALPSSCLYTRVLPSSCLFPPMLSRVSRQIFSQRGSNSHVPQDPMATGDVSMSLFLQLVLRNKKFKKIDFGPRSKKKKKNPVLDSLLCCRLSYLYQPRRSHRVISWLLACFNITRVSSPTQATTAQVHHTTFTSDVLVTKQT